MHHSHHFEGVQSTLLFIWMRFLVWMKNGSWQWPNLSQMTNWSGYIFLHQINANASIAPAYELTRRFRTMQHHRLDLKMNPKTHWPTRPLQWCGPTGERSMAVKIVRSHNFLFKLRRVWFAVRRRSKTKTELMLVIDQSTERNYQKQPKPLSSHHKSPRRLGFGWNEICLPKRKHRF